jgi:hypothetical protein
VFRPFRKAFQNIFKKSKLSKGRHHWNEDKWFRRVRKFLEEELLLYKISEREVAIAIILLYPAFGPSTGRGAIK